MIKSLRTYKIFRLRTDSVPTVCEQGSGIYLSDFLQVTVHPPVSINAATQGIRVADKLKQQLIILLSS